MENARATGVGLRARLLVAAAVLCLVVGGTLVVLLLSVQSLRQSSRRAQHSEQVIALANRLERLTLDVETGQRGYVLTGDERFLAPWRAAVAAAPKTARELEALVAADAVQRRRAASIRSALASYVDDFSRPLVQTARTSGARAREIVAAGEGRRRIDALRGMFDSFTATEAALSERNAARTADASQRARTAAAACAGVLLLLVALFLVYVARLITAPIRRVSAAAGALAAGEYSVRVPTTGAGEVEGLAHSFNDMAESLERAVSVVRTFYEFGESVAGETEMEPLAATIVEGLCRAGAADGATMHALVEDLDERFEFEHVATYGRTEPVGRELSLPLLHGDDAMLGVVTLCWADDAAAPDEEALSHLAGQAAVAWATATALARARRAATINRAVLAAARDSITLADRDGRVILRNPRAEAALPIYGISGATIQETTDALAERIVDPEPYREWIQRTRVDADYAGEYDFCLIESERSFQSVTSPVRDVDGEIIGRLFIVRETTAERETERLKTELVSTVSHELRTPLASIMGFTELLLARETDEQTRRQYLGTVYAEGKRLTGLVNQFLDFQRIERGELELHIDSVDLGMVVRDAAAAVEPQSVDHEIAVTVDDARLTVRADDERMRQVVANLLSNAIKYSPAGGRVALGACRTNGAVRVEVRDDGVGIPSAQQEGVFEKFFRADRSDTRSMGGAGLGLALCREIVEAHGGRIGFESRDGQGSTFWFEVPAESAA